MRECVRADDDPVCADAKFFFPYLYGYWFPLCGRGIFIYFYIIFPVRVDAGHVRADVVIHLGFSLAAGDANGGLM
jgi:hypothetical protein